MTPENFEKLKKYIGEEHLCGNISKIQDGTSKPANTAYCSKCLQALIYPLEDIPLLIGSFEDGEEKDDNMFIKVGIKNSANMKTSDGWWVLCRNQFDKILECRMRNRI